MPPLVEAATYQLPFAVAGVVILLLAARAEPGRRGLSCAAGALLLVYAPLAYGWSLLHQFEVVTWEDDFYELLVTVRLTVGALLLCGSLLLLIIAAAKRGHGAPTAWPPTAAPAGQRYGQRYSQQAGPPGQWGAPPPGPSPGWEPPQGQGPR